MKLGTSVWSIPAKDVYEKMDIAKRVGYDGIEIALENDGPTGMDSTPEDWAKIRKYAADLGLAIPSVATALHWQSPITSHDEAVREKAIAIVEKELEMAAALGADSILVVPGMVSGGKNGVRYDEAYDRAFAAIKRLAPVAEKHKVKIGLENVWNNFMLSPIEMRDFIDKIGSPYVGMYLDVGNLIAYAFPEQWIRILGERIVKVHFKDYRKSGGGGGWVDIMAGDVDWPQVMEAFREIGYDDWVTAEMGAYKHYPEAMLAVTLNAMKIICK